MNEEVKRWIEKAKSDLKHAKSSLMNKDFDWTQLASQQAAEKALKAVLVQKTNKNIVLVKKFKRDINKSIKIDKIILFGSRAKGNFHRYSDFDLLIVSPDFKGFP